MLAYQGRKCIIVQTGFAVYILDMPGFDADFVSCEEYTDGFLYQLNCDDDTLILTSFIIFILRRRQRWQDVYGVVCGPGQESSVAFPLLESWMQVFVHLRPDRMHKTLLGCAVSSTALFGLTLSTCFCISMGNLACFVLHSGCILCLHLCRTSSLNC